MAAINRFNVNSGIITALAASATIQSLLGGSPPRIAVEFVPRSTQDFPFVRMDIIPAPYFDGVFGPQRWLRRHVVQFSAFSKETSLLAVSDIQAAIANVLDLEGSVQFPGGNVVGVWPGAETIGFDNDTRSSFAMNTYEFVLQEA